MTNSAAARLARRIIDGEVSFGNCSTAAVAAKNFIDGKISAEKFCEIVRAISAK